MARRPRTVSTSARWVAVVLVVALAGLTLFLAFLAIERTRGVRAEARPASAPSFTFGKPSMTPSPTPTQHAGITYPRAEERFLTVGSGAMWRATAGECGSVAPVVERSTDGGESWENVTPLYRGIGEVLSLDAFAGTEAEMIARMGSACEIQALRTFTQGEFWEPYPDVLSASRYVDPANTSTVQSPDGTVSAPCADPRSFRAARATIALVCDGQAQVLRDGAWVPIGAPSTVGLAATADAVVTVSVQEGCDGAAVSRLSGADLATESLGCIPGVDPTQPLAVAIDEDSIILWSADALHRLP